MYGIKQFRKVIESPDLALREINRLYYSRLGQERGNPKGIDIFNEDWDNLIILDACRYDMFDQEHSLSGRLESRISKGSHTSEFLAANFAGRDLRDTVYVTASPMYYRNQEHLGTTFHDVVNVWRDAGWHDESRTVLPDTMADFATRTAKKYPEKRLIVHCLQPHYPFIGSIGREHFDLDKLNFEWSDARQGTLEISDEILWQAFRENLTLVLPHVEELLGELPGRTVVTSDHGQMIGERSSPVPMIEYGHPPGLYTDELVKVPWLIHDNGARKTVTAGEPVEQGQEIGEDEVRDRLESLGYVE
jgi:hypothetical protein